MNKYLVASVFFISSIAFAGVIERKAIRDGHTKIKEALAKLNKDCSASITVNSNHADIKTHKDSDRTLDNLITVSAEFCKDHINELIQICKDDDYKEEIAKLKTIECVADHEQKKPKTVAKVKGTELKFIFHPYIMDSEAQYKAVRKAF